MMQRPISIVQFERCYLGALVLGLVNTAVGWNERMQLVQVQQAQGMMGGAFVPVMLGAALFGAAITLLLWYLTARKGYVGAKWVVVVFYVLGLLALLLSVVQGTLPRGVPGILTVVVWVLNSVATWLLFRPDARRWFGEDSDMAGPAA